MSVLHERHSIVIKLNGNKRRLSTSCFPDEDDIDKAARSRQSRRESDRCLVDRTIEAGDMARLELHDPTGSAEARQPHVIVREIRVPEWFDALLAEAAVELEPGT